MIGNMGHEKQAWYFPVNAARGTMSSKLLVEESFILWYVILLKERVGAVVAPGI